MRFHAICVFTPFLFAGLIPATAQGYLMMASDSQATLTSITTATITTLGWTAAAVVRQAWGTQFLNELDFDKNIQVLGSAMVGNTVDAVSSNTTYKKMKNLRNSAKAGLWILWTNSAIQAPLMSNLNSLEIISPGNAYIVMWSPSEPPAHMSWMYSGFLAPSREFPSTYSAWYRSYISNTSQVSEIPGMLTDLTLA